MEIKSLDDDKNYEMNLKRKSMVGVESLMKSENVNKVEWV
jgi:hypothetical protein